MEKDKIAASASQKVKAWQEADRKKREEEERRIKEMEARIAAAGAVHVFSSPLLRDLAHLECFS